jgi:hypothetical protein
MQLPGFSLENFDKCAARFQAATARHARSFVYGPGWVKEPKRQK